MLRCPILRGLDEQLPYPAAPRGTRGDERGDIRDGTGRVDDDVARQAHESERSVGCIDRQENRAALSQHCGQSRRDVLSVRRVAELRQQRGNGLGIARRRIAQVNRVLSHGMRLRHSGGMARAVPPLKRQARYCQRGHQDQEKSLRTRGHFSLLAQRRRREPRDDEHEKREREKHDDDLRY